MLRFLSLPSAGAAARLRVLLLEWRVRFGGGLLVPLRGCCFKVLLFWSWCACCRVPLQGVASRRYCQSSVCALELACAAAGCHCRVLLSERCVRFGTGLLVPLQGAAAKLLESGVRAVWSWRLRGGRWLAGAAAWVPGAAVLLSKSCLHLRNLVAATGCCCQSTVCAMKLGAGVAAGGGCEMSMAVWADGGYVYAVEGRVLG